MQSISLLTIGQAPRHDMSDAIERSLAGRARILHAGVLDGFGTDEVELRFRAQAGEAVLITRLSDGRMVELDPAAIATGLQAKVAALEDQGVEIVVVMCTGRFPALDARRAWLIEPDALVPVIVANMVRNRQLGVVVPLPAQIDENRTKWRLLATPALFDAASPYGNNECLIAAARRLRDRGADAIVLDCMGYTEAHKHVMTASVGLPVFVSGCVVAAALSNLL